MIGELSIESHDITNEDIVVTYTPSSYVSSYSYKIIKNNKEENLVQVNNNNAVDITLNSTGTYKIEITNYDIYGVSNTYMSGEYLIDKEAPIINIKDKTYKIKENDNINILNDITASDMVDGDLTGSIKTNKDSLDFSTPGIKKVEYIVSDKAGNIAKEIVYVTVKQDNTNLIRAGQFSVIIVALLIFMFLYKYIRSIKLEKRFSKYTINSSKNKSISLFDNLNIQYEDFIDKFSKIINKSTILSKHSKRYTKYVEALGKEKDTCIKFMTKKILLGFGYIIIAIISKLFRYSLITGLEMIIPFILGFYTLDIIYFYKYRVYKRKVETDLLEAITLMNNAFKSGRSIMQAVDLVSSEIDGPISKEFKKISMELSLGLDIEVAFRRFSDRIKLKEASYLTSSLSVLNKTGGNIIKVFDSIEKNLFNRRKLQVELKSLTSSSKLIMYVLILVPIAFVIFISIINFSYFEPLFKNPLGLALIGLMILIYISYIFVVTRVMRVRM